MLSTDIQKADLQKLVKQIKAGHEITLEDQGEPIAKLVPLSKRAKKPRKLGLAPNIKIADDFDEWPDDFAFPFGKEVPEE